MTRGGPGAAAGAVLVAAAVALGCAAVNAIMTPTNIAMVGTVTGPCGTPPSSAVRVYADGELVGSGSIGTSHWADTCSGTISVNSVEPADEYTVDADPLSAQVSADRVSETMGIRMEAK